MNNIWAFLPMRSSTDLIGQPDELRARLDEDSYLYFPGLLDPRKVMALRRAMVQELVTAGWIDPAVPMRARSIRPPVREGDDDFFAAYARIQRLEQFHTLAHDDALTGVMRDVLGASVFPHPLKIARLIFPGHHEISTPPHQDFPNNQGTANLTATWIPVGDVDTTLGGLAILRGSHHHGLLGLDRHLGPGNRQAVVPMEVLEACRWVTTDFRAGDVLVFGSHTVHASLHNASEFHLRLSVDFRWQLEGEALTAGCLQPHFGRLTWDEVYEGWASAEHQYYWRNLDFEVVPFEELQPEQTDGATEEAIIEFARYEQRVRARFERISGID